VVGHRAGHSKQSPFIAKLIYWPFCADLVDSVDSLDLADSVDLAELVE
jgi:hypothetical protein